MKYLGLFGLLILISGSVFATVLNVPSQYPTIQEAVDAAVTGDTVLVAAGTYLGNVAVDKSISLIGDSTATVVLDGQGVGSVVTIMANSVVVKHLGFTNAGAEVIEDIVVDAGISMENADSCLIEHCRFFSNGAAGVSMALCSHNTVTDCAFSDANYGIVLYGRYMPPPYEDNIGNTIRRCSFTLHTGTSILFAHAGSTWNRENQIEENYIVGNRQGIVMVLSYDNVISYNHISNNDDYGIFYWECSGGGGGNLFHHNSFIDNGINAEEMGAGWFEFNEWASALDGEGNYWSDYTGVDADSNGIGDDVYFIPNDGQAIADWLPLMWRSDPYGQCVGIRGNINGDLADAIDIADLVFLVDYMFNAGLPPISPGEGDVNGSGGLDISDLVYLVDYMFTGGPAPPACD